MLEGLLDTSSFVLYTMVNRQQDYNANQNRLTPPPPRGAGEGLVAGDAMHSRASGDTTPAGARKQRILSYRMPPLA